jgi:signal transduction histidine kinase
VSVRVLRSGTHAVLEVTDDGTGLTGPVEDASAGEADDGGTHFGLRIIRDLVADAGGTLTLGPAPGGGTALHVELPIP